MDTHPKSSHYFGWNIVAVATFITLLTVGMRLGIGPLFLPIAEDLAFSRSTLSSIIAIGMLCYGIGMPLAAYLVNRIGTTWVLNIGAIMVLIATIWTIYATTTLGFLLSFGILMSFGFALTSPVALTPVISRWFTRQRGMALFFLSTGSMAGIAIMTPLLSFAVDMAGWKMTLLGFAILFIALTVPSALYVIRDIAPEHTDLSPEQIASVAKAPPAAPPIAFKDAIVTSPFLKITLGLFACGFSMNLLGTHGVPMLMDHGFDAMTSSYGIGLIGLTAIFSTLVLGRMSDRMPRKNLIAAIYMLRGVGFFILLIVGTHWELYAAAVLGGVVWAGSIALSSAILADIYGIRLVGMLYGCAYFGHQIGAMASSWLGGWAFETYGTHWIAFGSAGAILIAAAVISFQLPPRGYTISATMSKA